MRPAFAIPLAAHLFFAPAAALAEDVALSPYTVENAASVPEPLGGHIGDVAVGPAVFARMECGVCHALPGEEPGGAIGPDLSDVGARLTPGEIRLMVIDPRIIFPDTDMPGYYAVGVYGEAPDEQVGRTLLTAQEVEAVVAWLSTFTQARDDAAGGGD